MTEGTRRVIPAWWCKHPDCGDRPATINNINHGDACNNCGRPNPAVAAKKSKTESAEPAPLYAVTFLDECSSEKGIDKTIEKCQRPTLVYDNPATALRVRDHFRKPENLPTRDPDSQVMVCAVWETPALRDKVRTFVSLEDEWRAYEKMINCEDE